MTMGFDLLTMLSLDIRYTIVSSQPTGRETPSRKVQELVRAACTRTQRLFHKAMLEALTSGEHLQLGDAVLAAREDYAETGAFPELLAIYHLFGDPALKLR